MLNKMDRSTIEKLLEKEDLTHFAKSVDRLRFITRYATAPRSSKESVAEHSFFVAAYVLKLAQSRHTMQNSHNHWKSELKKRLLKIQSRKLSPKNSTELKTK